uniref:Uncharacterized protein n=1 Tax=Anguilla anguilla TaxID=7936 RepID=A0A0E9TE96_ANGAN
MYAGYLLVSNRLPQEGTRMKASCLINLN